MNLIDKFIGYVSPEKAARRAAARQMISALDDFKAAENNRLRDDWILPGQSAGVDADQYKLWTMRERARYAKRNDPLAAGVSNTYGHNVVGQGLKLQSRMRADMVGLPEERVKVLQMQAERAWNKFCKQADASNILTMDEIQFMALTKVIEDGESIIIPTMANEPWRHYKRCLQMIESERLETPAKQANNENVKNGIKFGSRGQPKTYYIRKTNNIGDINNNEFAPYAAKDSEGRPKILHIYPQKRPGQTRGYSLFAPVLTYFKDLGDYLEAEVIAARVAACLAVFITKEDPYRTASLSATGTETNTNARIQGIEPGFVGYLNTGESINVVDPKRPGENTGDFIEKLIRFIGAGLDLPYELILKDFSKTNYSSARAALLEGRRVFNYWRWWLALKLLQPIYELVLEEAYLRGDFEARGFYDLKDEFCRANWVGGAWGWVDPVKEVQAARDAINYNLSTLADETAAQGKDWEEVLKQRQSEKAAGDDAPRPDAGQPAAANNKNQETNNESQ